MPSRPADFEQLAVVAGFERDAELSATVQPCHDWHNGDDRLAPGVFERCFYAWLLAELDQMARGVKRQLETPALAACQRFARRKPDRIGGFPAVVRADLRWGSRGEKEPGIEPLRHPDRRDPMRIRHELVERQREGVLGKHRQEGGIALRQGDAI